VGGAAVPISILVADRNNLATDALRRALSQHYKQFKVVGCAYTGKDLLKQAAESQPDVTLVSANLEGKPAEGLRALRELHLTRPSTQAIALLDCSDPELVVEAFSCGARGVFCKSEGLPELRKCIRSVYAGQVWADNRQLQSVVQALQKRGMIRIVSAKGTPLLTKREEQIVGMVAEGLSNNEIRRNLGLSPHTVKNHLFHIYNKLGISNRAELMLYALASRDVLRG
jgi:DNA-binding NarL/FixJ family response regulator